MDSAWRPQDHPHPTPQLVRHYVCTAGRVSGSRQFAVTSGPTPSAASGERIFCMVAMPFYTDHIYPQLVRMLGNPKPIRDVRQRIIPLAQKLSEKVRLPPVGGSSNGSLRCRSLPRYWPAAVHSPYPTADIGLAKRTSAQPPSAASAAQSLSSRPSATPARAGTSNDH